MYNKLLTLLSGFFAQRLSGCSKKEPLPVNQLKPKPDLAYESGFISGDKITVDRWVSYDNYHLIERIKDNQIYVTGPNSRTQIIIISQDYKFTDTNGDDLVLTTYSKSSFDKVNLQNLPRVSLSCVETPGTVITNNNISMSIQSKRLRIRISSNSQYVWIDTKDNRMYTMNDNDKVVTIAPYHNSSYLGATFLDPTHPFAQWGEIKLTNNEIIVKYPNNVLWLNHHQDKYDVYTVSTPQYLGWERPVFKAYANTGYTSLFKSSKFAYKTI